ncbi:hypothetical protein ACIP98_07865 [Streptomyces sp. NPDC088354]|uniref:hypothetical protein n=1 Tax=Streptomyces sp. NPDC088354 TaxID=3365856 RepID=UPI0037FED361
MDGDDAGESGAARGAGKHAARRSPGGRAGVFFAFVPWIAFDIVAGPSTWELAALVGLVASVVLSVPDVAHGSVKLLDVTGIVFFTVVSLLGLSLDRQDLLWLETYAQVLANAVIAAVALGSLAFVPFTEQYARESTPREVWGTPAFQRTNRVLTLVWGGVFLVTAVLGLVAVHVTAGTDWLNWVLPIALLVLAVRFTDWYPRYVREQVHKGVAEPDR